MREATRKGRWGGGRGTLPAGAIQTVFKEEAANGLSKVSKGRDEGE